MLSKTIRAFSSSDQRRRRPVSTTSSRLSALIVWLSIRTVLNHQTTPSQGVFPRTLTIDLTMSNEEAHIFIQDARAAGLTVKSFF